MNKQIITFDANEQSLIKTGGVDKYSSNKVSYIEAHFNLGENWSGYDSVRAVWFTWYECISTVLDTEGICIVPYEVLKRTEKVMVNLVGSISEDDVLADRITTYPIKALEVDADAKVCGSNTQPITPSEYEQFVEAVKADADRAEEAKEDARGFASSAEISAQNASISETNASTSEDNAKASELNAETYKNQAQTYAQNANNSAISAENAKDEAEDARDTILGMRAEATTLPEGSSATASYNDGVMSFGIPKGDTGATGATGETGATPQLSIGTVETTTEPIVTITGTAENPVLNFGLVKGDKGDTGEVSQAEFDAAITDVKSDFSAYTDVMEKELLTPTLVNNWKLLSTGVSSGSNACAIAKYQVTAGDVLHLKLDTDEYNTGTYQFQSDSSVPAQAPNQYLIGTTVTGAVDDIVVVPTGATYLIVGQLKTNTTNKVHNLSKAYKDLIATANSALKHADNAYIFSVFNVAKGGIYIDGNKVKTNKNGFGIRWNNAMYYIAPTDQSTEYTFGGSSKNEILVINTTKLTNVNGRNNPDVVLEIHNPTGMTDDYIPVAYRFNSTDSFEFLGAFSIFNEKQAEQRKPFNALGTFAETQLIAHRGGNATTKDTYANYESAISNGYKVVEMDVRFTSDDVLVISHDATITVGGTTYTISNETYSTLIGVAPNLAKLEDVLLLCKKKNVIAELDFTKKYSTEQCALLYALINSLGMQGRCLITCYSASARTLLSYSENLCICISGINDSTDVANIADIASTAWVCFCSTETTYISKSLVDEIHENGMFSKVWTVNTVADINTMFGYGCDMIITDSVKPNEI